MEELLDDYITYQHTFNVNYETQDKILVKEMLAEAEKKIAELLIKLEGRRFAKLATDEFEDFDSLSLDEQILAM